MKARITSSCFGWSLVIPKSFSARLDELRSGIFAGDESQSFEQLRDVIAPERNRRGEIGRRAGHELDRAGPGVITVDCFVDGRVGQ